MSRSLRAAAVFLALGLGLNVVVAWACAIWMPSPTHSVRLAEEAPKLTGAPAAWGSPVFAEVAARAGLVAAEESWLLVILEGQPDLLTLDAAAELRWSEDVPISAMSETIAITTGRRDVGLPFRSMRWRFVEFPSGIDPPPGYRPPVSRLGRGLVGFDSLVGQAILAQRDRRLPVVPIWMGFVGNSVVYGAALGAVLVGVPALRRSARRARGRCEHCSYPVGGSPVCTECGRPVGGPGEEAAV